MINFKPIVHDAFMSIIQKKVHCYKIQNYTIHTHQHQQATMDVYEKALSTMKIDVRLKALVLFTTNTDSRNILQALEKVSLLLYLTIFQSTPLTMVHTCRVALILKKIATKTLQQNNLTCQLNR